MSMMELMLMLAALGLQQPGGEDPYVTRNLGVLVHSAEARRVNQVVLENNFLEAVAAHHRFWLPKNPGSMTKRIEHGRFAFEQRNFQERGFAVPFTLDKGGAYDYFVPTEPALERLRTPGSRLTNQFVFLSSDGAPLKELALPKVAENTKDFHVKFFALAAKSTEMAPKEDAKEDKTKTKEAKAEYLIDQSVIVEVGDRELIGKRLAALRESLVISGTFEGKVKGDEKASNADRAWATGREVYSDHYHSMGVNVEIAPQVLGKAPQFRRLGEYLMVAHPFQSTGRMVLPILDDPGAKAKEVSDERTSTSREPMVLSKVVRAKGSNEIRGAHIDFSQFLSRVLVANNALLLDATAEYDCLGNAERADESACKTIDGRKVIEFDLGSAATAQAPAHQNSFLIWDSNHSRIWNIRLSVRPLNFGSSRFAPIRERTEDKAAP